MNRYGNHRSGADSNSVSASMVVEWSLADSGRFSRYLILVGKFQINPIFTTFLRVFWGFQHEHLLFLKLTQTQNVALGLT